MGTLSQGILGPVKNKIGPVVGFTWKGINALRSYNDSPANPQTAAQVSNRQRFAAVQLIASLLLTSIVKPLWDRFASRMSGYNNFIKANFPAFDSTGLVNFSELKIAQGSLTGVDTQSFTSSNGTAVVAVTWSNNSGTGSALASDLYYCVVLNEDTGEMQVSSGLVARSVGTVNVTLGSNNTTGDTIYVWGAFKKADGTMVSATAYSTALVP